MEVFKKSQKDLSAQRTPPGQERFLYFFVSCLAALQIFFFIIFYGEMNTLKVKFSNLEKGVDVLQMMSEDGEIHVSDIRMGTEFKNSRQKRQAGVGRGSGDPDNLILNQRSTAEPTLPPRLKECSIKQMGVSAYVGDYLTLRPTFGSWMVDMKPSLNSVKVWVTYNIEGNYVLEYNNWYNFENDIPARNITLNIRIPYYGTGHIVYDGYMYYHWSGEPKVVKMDLSSGQIIAVRVIPGLVFKNEGVTRRYLYSSENTFVDFGADTNGLWMIHGTEKRNNVRVALMNPETLDIIKYFDLDIPLGSKGEAFILCGKLITLQSHNLLVSKLDTEFDMWTNTSKTLDITIKNPFRKTVMLSFDERKERFLIWDNGYIVRLPIRTQIP